MPLHINTNVPATGVRRQLQATTTRLQDSFSKLSSGLRIRVAADDAAGLGISERMRARLRSMDASSRNAQAGSSMLKTAEAGLSEISGLLTRMRELAVSAANGTIATSERLLLNHEFQELKDEIDVLAKTEFNGIKLLNNTTVHSFRVGVDNGDVISVGNVDARTVTLGISTNGVGTTDNANLSMTSVDAAIDTVSDYRGSRGANINRLESAYSNLRQASTDLSAAESRIRDVDVAFETSILARNTILQEAATSVLVQANAHPAQALMLLGI